jgi:hypothetical protein
MLFLQIPLSLISGNVFEHSWQLRLPQHILLKLAMTNSKTFGKNLTYKILQANLKFGFILFNDESHVLK